MSRVRVLAELDADHVVAFLREHFGRRLVQVAATCTIDYEGRAASTLPLGSRLVLMKADGTLLVHGSEKLKPVNWQPPGCAFAAERVDGRVVLTAAREKPRELVRIAFHDVDAVLAIDLDDGVSLEVTGTEDDLQAFLARSPHVIEPGFRFWSRERASGRGPMDLYGEDAAGRRVVVECKRRAAGVAEADQLRRYVERERNARGEAQGATGEARRVRGILVAPGVSEKARRYLDESGLEYREVDWEKLMRPARDALKSSGQRTLGYF